jgi:hypothetical protein
MPLLPYSSFQSGPKMPEERLESKRGRENYSNSHFAERGSMGSISRSA